MTWPIPAFRAQSVSTPTFPFSVLHVEEATRFLPTALFASIVQLARVQQRTELFASLVIRGRHPSTGCALHAQWERSLAMINLFATLARRASTATMAWRARNATVALSRMAQRGPMSAGREPQVVSSVLTRMQAWMAAYVQCVLMAGRLTSSAPSAKSVRQDTQALVASACHVVQAQHLIPAASFVSFVKSGT